MASALEIGASAGASALGAAATSNPYVGIPLAAVNFVSGLLGNNRNMKLQQEQWRREDTAHQREVADLKAAGLSPLAALGGAPSSTQIAPQVAPQFDMNTVSDFYNQNMENFRQANQLRHDVSEKQKDRTLQKEIVSQNIDAAQKSLDQQINATASENEKNRILDLRKSLDILQLQQSEHDFNVANTYDSKFREEVRAATGVSVNYYPVPPEQYKAESDVWSAMFAAEVKRISSLNSSESVSDSTSDSDSTSTSTGLSGGVSNPLSVSPSLGLNNSNSVSKSESKSHSEGFTRNLSREDKLLAAWLEKNPKPVCDDRLKGQSQKYRYYTPTGMPSSAKRMY